MNSPLDGIFFHSFGRSDMIKKILLLVLFVMPMTVLSQKVSDVTLSDVRMVKSPESRVAVLELYTSEGCSSCPPADHFLSELKKAGISSKQLIPMAFHVTYWDYIGWSDRFAKKQFDQRQRDAAYKKRSKSVYTPQFRLSGDDYRSYASFSKDVNRLVEQAATIDLELSLRVLSDQSGKENLSVSLKSNNYQSDVKDLGYYFAVVENNLLSDVEAGENDGEQLHHDYVVRELLGPYSQSGSDQQYKIEKTINLHSEWQKNNLSIVAFVENLRTGEILQAVRMKY